MARPSYNPDLFHHWHTIKTRFRDIDVLNHVNNAVFNTYFEEARINFVESVPELGDSFEKGQSYVLVKCTLEYLKPITYPSTLLIGSGFLKIGNSSIEAFQSIYEASEKQLHAVAYTKGVWFDLKAQKPTKFPDIKGIEKMMVALDG